jgi:uncharacterized Zn-binding protein involved in type VI secretion
MNPVNLEGKPLLRLPEDERKPLVVIPANPMNRGQPAGRLLDRARNPADNHGCPTCPHAMVIGPAIVGSPNVFINGLPALRKADMGKHVACCGPNSWMADKGSLLVNINGRPAFRKGDVSRHCGGWGQLTEGSPNVLIGG